MELRAQLRNVRTTLRVYTNEGERRNNHHSIFKKRHLTRLLKSALPISNAQLARARARSDLISSLPSPRSSPNLVETLSELARSLPDPELPRPESLMPSDSQLQDSSRRPWERGRIGYDQWATSRLIERTNVLKDTEIENVQLEVFGDAEELWAAHGAIEAEKASRPRDLELAEVESDPKKRRLE